MSNDETPTKVKICGLSTVEAVDASVKFGTDYIGFVFFEKSPRHVSFQLAKTLIDHIPSHVQTVALMVNPTIDLVDNLLAELSIDFIQLHGAETPDYCQKIKEDFDIPIMKAIGIETPKDIISISKYSDVVDQVLLDAKPAKTDKLPGGNGIAFDWDIINSGEINLPWMLAGGLNPLNVAEAINKTGTQQVDVSSGVESAPGIKDIAKIEAFIQAAKRTKDD